jgi:hypothetical protein
VEQSDIITNTADIFDVIIGVAWPISILIIVLILRRPFKKLIEKDQISIQIPNGPRIQLSSNEASDVLSRLFNDFLLAYNELLNDYQKAIYRKILSHKDPPTVSELIPDFSRDNQDHIGCLRALRGIGLIRPGDNRSWTIDSRIVITKFGTSLNKYIKNSY